MEEEYSESDWIEDLDIHFNSEFRKPGDIDARQIAKRYNVCLEHALRKMSAIARDDPGNWEVLLVRDGRSKPPIKVLRKKC